MSVPTMKNDDDLRLLVKEVEAQGVGSLMVDEDFVAEGRGANRELVRSLAPAMRMAISFWPTDTNLWLMRVKKVEA